MVMERDSVSNERRNRISADNKVEVWKLVNDGFDLGEIGHTAELKPLKLTNKEKENTSRDSPLIRYKSNEISTRAK